MGIVESFSSTPVRALDPAWGPDSEILADGADLIDAARIHALVESKRGIAHWPAEIEQQYRAEVTGRIERDQNFLFLIGLLVAVATLLVDQIVNPAMVKEGAMLRVLMIAPLTMLGLFAANRKWHAIAAFCVGACPIAFATVVVHLALHLPPEASARYLAAAAMIMGFANFVLPFSTRGLVLFDACFIAAVTIASVFDVHPHIGQSLDYILTLVIIAASTLPIAYRFERLRQHNFLLNLHSRTTMRELMLVNDQLRDLSNRDPLTGLPNRRFFKRLFDELVEAKIGINTAPQHQGCRVAVLMLDLDHFKAFNDTHGHVAGDEALRIVGHELDSIMSGFDGIAARYGGEEFVGALCVATREEAEQVAEQVRKTIATLLIPIWPAGRSIITTSVGIAVAPEGEPPPREELIAAADDALYMAKDAGRNRVEMINLDNGVRAAAE